MVNSLTADYIDLIDELILQEAGKCNLENDRDLEGRSPLHIAAWQGNASMVELLIRYGADVNAVDREQRTPLQSAAWQGHESVVWLLLKHGASGDQPCSQGATPLSIGEPHEQLQTSFISTSAFISSIYENISLLSPDVVVVYPPD